jgi:hypothetical protein
VVLRRVVAPGQTDAPDGENRAHGNFCAVNAKIDAARFAKRRIVQS